MKYLMTLVLACMVYLTSTLASVSYEETLAWENAAKVYLNVGELEIYNVVVEGQKVTFEYDKEFYNPFVIATFKCTGISYEGQTTFQSLECVEEEPTLWDEF